MQTRHVFSDSSEDNFEHRIGTLSPSSRRDAFRPNGPDAGSALNSGHKQEDFLQTPQLSAMKSKKGCNCQRSRCIKLYCECYANGVHCKDCNCVDCLNNGHNEVCQDSPEL